MRRLHQWLFCGNTDSRHQPQRSDLVLYKPRGSPSTANGQFKADDVKVFNAKCFVDSQIETTDGNQLTAGHRCHPLVISRRNSRIISRATRPGSDARSASRAFCSRRLRSTSSSDASSSRDTCQHRSAIRWQGLSNSAPNR